MAHLIDEKAEAQRGFNSHNHTHIPEAEPKLALGDLILVECPSSLEHG